MMSYFSFPLFDATCMFFVKFSGHDKRYDHKYTMCVSYSFSLEGRFLELSKSKNAGVDSKYRGVLD